MTFILVQEKKTPTEEEYIFVKFERHTRNNNP